MTKWQQKSGSKNQSRAALKLVSVILSRFFCAEMQKENERVDLLFWVGISKHRCEQNQKVMLIVLLGAFCLFFASWLCESWFIFNKVTDYHKFFPFIFLLTPYPEAYFPATEIGGSAWSIKRGATFWIVREECPRPLCDRSGVTCCVWRWAPTPY